MLYKSWFRIPEKLINSYIIIFPLIIAQILQRIFPIIDNRYFTLLGIEATYLHNIQYNFITLGQFIGLATYISSLVFWNRSTCKLKQGNILVKHIMTSGLFTLSLAVIFWMLIPLILTQYKVSLAYYPIAYMYLKISLINMVIQAVFGSVDGMLIGTKQQKNSMFISAFLLIGNWFFDYYALFSIYEKNNTSEGLYHAILFIGLSTTLLLSLSIIIGLLLIRTKIQGWDKFTFKEMFPVWWGELGVYLIRGIVPFIYAYQMCFMISGTHFLTTYQFILHISYIFCFPLIAAMQIAIRDGENWNTTTPWWNTFFYTGLVPTSILIALGIFAAVPLIHYVYQYDIPLSHIKFLSLFFVSTWIGQIGNTLTIPLRIDKKSYLVTKNFFISELVILIGGTQLLIFKNNATALTLGYVTVLFSITYTMLNLFDVLKLNKIQYLGNTYEKLS